MSPFIIKQLHRQRIQFSSSHFFFHDCVSQKGQKHNYRMQQHANKEISTAGLQANIGCKLWRVLFANNVFFFFWSFIPETFFTAVLQCDKGLFKKKGITLPLFQSLEFTFVLRENTKKAVSLADQQWHDEEEALCVHAFIPCAKEFKHRVLSFIRNAHLFHISECLNVCRRCIAANACLPILQPATILGHQVGTGVGSHGSSFGRPACHRGA